MRKPISTKNYAKIINRDFNKIWYVHLIAGLDTHLDGLKDRFDKSDIIEQGIAEYSNNRFVWIDEIGRDLHDTKCGVDLEIKYLTNSIYTPTKKPKKIIKIRLKNNLRINNGIIIKKPAEYYIICQQDAMGIISYKDLKPYLISVSDGIEANIPFDKLSLVFKPEEIPSDLKPFKINYKDKKSKMQMSIINNIKKRKIKA